MAAGVGLVMFERRPDVNAPLDLDEKDIRFLREVVIPQRTSSVKEDASYTFEICPTCASPIWKQTVFDGKSETKIALGGCCDRCSAFQFRHPEVFAFVTQYGQASRFIMQRLRPKDGGA